MLKIKFYIFFFISIAFSSCAQNEKSEQEILQSKINHGKQYKNGGLGEKGAYGLANVKQDVMLKLSPDDMEHINLYIETLISKEKNK